MKANAVPLLAVFEKKLRLEVPLFQRQYVWNQEKHWEPLWEDVSRKFTEFLEGRKDAPVHFLGAMVFDQKQTPTTHVEKRQVIDGQQRLTTLQIFISALRDFCRENDCEELARECESFTLNKGMMVEPEVDRFKVWPTLLDRTQFSDVVASGSRTELILRHPLTKQPYARKPNPRPRMVEAYLFFYDQMQEYFLGDAGDPPIAAEVALGERFEECFQALKNALQVVVIDLEQGDDAQVIFETLNARGEPLLPADLLRNFIFLRAARLGEPQEPLYEKYWKRFDDPFWRVEVKQGRLTRPRSDLYMQHFLSSRQGIDIPIKHLFVEYKFWIDRNKPFESVSDELRTLSRQGDHFRRIIDPKKDDLLFGLVTFLDAFDIRTAYPLLLALLEAELDESEWSKISGTLESFLVRRSVCGLTTKNYNRVFLGVTKSLRREGFTHANLLKELEAFKGDSTVWPTDAAFSEAWRSVHVYGALNNPKVVHLFRRLNDTFMMSKKEKLSFDGPLSIEHLLPQQWIENWPLPDGSKGVDVFDLLTVPATDGRAIATRKRNAALQTFGNLTILSQALNSSVSNSSWPTKKKELLKHSLLPINQELPETWDEFAIAARSEALLKRALLIWPRS